MKRSLLALGLALLLGNTHRLWAQGDTTSTASSLSVGSSYGGSIDWAGDEDWFRLEISSSGTLTAYTTGDTDTYGYILNSSGSSLTSDDDSGEGLNFYLSYGVSAGTYYIRLRHYSSEGTGDYTLYTSFTAGGGGTTTSSSSGDDYGNSMGSAASLSLGASLGGSINYSGDEDYFQVFASSSGTLTAYTTGNTDTYGYLLDASGSTLASNDDNPYPNFQFSYSIAPGTYYLRVRHWSSGGTGSYTLYTSFSGSGGGGISSNSNSNSSSSGSASLASALDNTSFSWSTGGNSSWFEQAGTSYSGGSAARSGWISHDQATYLETSVTGPGTLSFYWQVSSENNYDYLGFSIDGLYQSSICGEVGWTGLSYNLSSGSHTLRWTYSTDSSVLSGSNAGWVDWVQFTPASPPPPPVSATPDLVWRHRNNGLNSLWFMNNSVLEQSQPILPDLVPDLDWQIVGAGDFNSDGQKDLVWQHRSTGVIGVWFMNGRAMAGVALTTPDRASHLGWRIVGVDDFNRDGKPDLLWQHEDSTEVAIWHMDGVTLASPTLTSPSAPNDWGWKVMGTGDFNRDGYPDLVWEHRDWGLVALWYMNDNLFVSSTLTDPTGVDDLDWQVTGTGDFNRDGQTDITWQHESTGMVSVWYMSNYAWLYPTVFSPAYPESPSWKVQTVGDFQANPNPDTDNDLLPDFWEQAHFGNLTQSAGGDYDGDSVTNLQEFRTGTNPTLANVTIKIARPRVGSPIP